MALIKCPECGKEISDKASNCPNCGCPMGKQEIKVMPSLEVSTSANESLDEVSIKKNVFKMKFIIPMIAGIIIVVISAFYDLKVIKPKNMYLQATKLLDNGEYDEANKLLSKINTYKNVKKMREEVQYETYVFSCINEIKQYLKNPDSFSPYEITFYNSLGENNGQSGEIVKNETNDDKKYPICIMHYTAQNGFGGNTTGYAMFKYSNEKDKYQIFGTCNSLDEEDYDKTDKDEILDLIVCKFVKLYQEGEHAIGNVNMNRIKTVLKNENYKTIKIIE